MSENHPAWKAWHIHQSQFSYPSKPTKSKLYDQDADKGNPELMRAIKQHAHELGMIKDLMIVLMNLLEKQGETLEQHSDILEETADMIDILITFDKDDD